jgi:predicted Zn-dependent protease
MQVLTTTPRPLPHRYPDEPRLAAALLDAAETPAAVRKLAKTLLRRSPAALPLWLAYARAEERQGRFAEAFTVYARGMHVLTTTRAFS